MAKPRDLAERIGVSEATISRLASGTRRPSVTKMAEIEKVLGWSVADQAAAYLDRTYGTKLLEKMETWIPPQPQEATADAH